MSEIISHSSLPPVDNPLNPKSPWLLPFGVLCVAYSLLGLTLTQPLSHMEMMQRCVLMDPSRSRLWSVGNIEVGLAYLGVFSGMLFYFLRTYSGNREHLRDLGLALAYLFGSFALDYACVQHLHPFAALLIGDAVVISFTALVSRQIWFQRLLGVFVPLVFLTCGVGHFLEGLSYWHLTYPVNTPWTMVTADIGFAILLNASRFPAFLRGEDVVESLAAERARSSALQEQIASRLKADAQRDLAEQARSSAEQARQKSENLYRTLFETMSQGVVYQNADGLITATNPAAERLLGLTFDQMSGRTSADPRWQAVREDGSELPAEQHPAMIAARTGQPVQQAVIGVFNPQLETTRWLQISATPEFRAGETRPYQVYTMFEDITEQKAAAAALQEAAERQKTLLRDVLSSVTGGRLRLVEAETELPDLLPNVSEPISLTPTEGLYALRQEVKEAALRAGFTEARWQEVVTAASEGAMNAITHGGGQGEARVSSDGRPVVQVRVRDWGIGINMENLPKAALQRGWSSSTSLGHGLVMMLECVDRLWLLTGLDGTTVVMEQGRDEPTPAWL